MNKSYKIMEYSAKELFDILNQQDECDWIEAKGGKKSSRSAMETVCAYSNEPGLGGGYILLGVAEEITPQASSYKTIHIGDPDKIQSDFASQCASIFNIPIRPNVFVEQVNGATILKIWVAELPSRQKPLYFKEEGLPQGAFRRIGPTDQRCTEDDMHIFYTDYKSYDQTSINDTSLDDVDETALKRYRTLREKINPAAEELAYDNDELLEALGCLDKKNKAVLTLAGMVLFGTSKALRLHFPMLRVDYIRVPGNQWVEDPDRRFTTIDMRGPLLILIYRLIDAINADLPQGFLLPEGNLQASPIGLPTKALREAILNAFMHRSYREHQPIQVIRYDNRIEIINPGYSLKAEELLGTPGSKTRNPFIAAIFHETNLAETKGSGIRAMRRLMENAHLAPPTFESDRSHNRFTSRLLLHHFLNKKDIQWLAQFDSFKLSDSQKQALIFVREVGAIDNRTYRQMADTDMTRASAELRQLKTLHLIEAKGKGKATYYIAGKKLSTPAKETNTPAREANTPAKETNTPARGTNTPAKETNTPAKKKIDDKLLDKIRRLGKRVDDRDLIKTIIKEICTREYHTSNEIAKILSKREDYIKRRYISPMIKEGLLSYRYPEMISHPQQAYRTIKKEPDTK